MTDAIAQVAGPATRAPTRGRALSRLAEATGEAAGAGRGQVGPMADALLVAAITALVAASSIRGERSAADACRNPRFRPSPNLI